ncbi:sulfur carrier protein ThiS [Alkaliphilus hydrothermalis]|uniref:Thiamine biosynthesis protein ThiS n=1 Tax=Alkaliphilus hydrothermalis TaxID=1482730 RepID=A0ABS2NLD6_9FIRM|nr:sulfur carrier protein ThiS [Alkaliphilus hydrothermalis]MBM7613747.1 thiamine biosynthesis protein ThiS [Alkaliphilus hydrothermalis]
MKVNGKIFAWEEGLTVQELLKKLDYSHTGLILSVNDMVISSGDYASHILEKEDDVKIVHPIVGG